MVARYSCLMSVALLSGALVPVTAPADPIQWSADGHWYEYIEVVVSWPEAEFMAEARTWQGNPGYLATTTSASSPPENWHWVTDEAWDFTHCTDTEPNDYDEPFGEQYLQFSPCCAGRWNDHHSENPKAFIVVYSSGGVEVERRSWGDVKVLYR